MHLNFRLVVPGVKMHFLFAPSARVASRRIRILLQDAERPWKTRAKNRCRAFVRCHGRGGNVRHFEILLARSVLHLDGHVERRGGVTHGHA